MSERMVEPIPKDTLPQIPWADARDDRLEFDRRRCRAGAFALPTPCDMAPTGRLEVHHRLPRGRGGSNERENLVTLCPGHHRWVETNRAAAYDLGLLVRSS